MASNQSMVWNIDKATLQNLKSAHIYQAFHSEIYGGMYSLSLIRMASHFAVELYLCGFPKGKRKIDVSWNLRVIAKGVDFEKVIIKSTSTKLMIDDKESGILTDEDCCCLDYVLSFENLLKNDSLLIHADVILNVDQTISSMSTESMTMYILSHPRNIPC